MRTTRPFAVLAGTAATVVLLAIPASAHVTVHSYDAVSGGSDAELDFRVPNELSNAVTNKILIALPADEPIAGALAAPKPGWTVKETSINLKDPIVTDDGKITTAVSTVVWTADKGGGIPVGSYDDFYIAAGQMPKTTSMTFKALQYYSNGTVVSWIQEGDDSDHPAPVLDLTSASGASDTPSSEPSVSATATTSTPTTVKASSDSTAKTLGGTGLGLGVVALLVAVGAFIRGGRSSAKG